MKAARSGGSVVVDDDGVVGNGGSAVVAVTSTLSGGFEAVHEGERQQDHAADDERQNPASVFGIVT